MECPPLDRVLDFALSAARQAGDLTLKHFRTDVVVERKLDRTPVTVADRGAEELLRGLIEKAWPDHGVLGEEFGERPGRVPARWILDPIDGTYSFICGVPLYSVLIGFEWDGAVVAGVLHLPALRETLWASRGGGAFWNDRPARVSGVRELADARLVTTGTKNLYQRGRGTAFERLRESCYADRAWSDAYAYALIATGRAEIAIDPVMSIWDTAALLPIVTEAGGTFTDWSGRTTHTAPESVATNGALFDATMSIIRGK